MKFSINIIISMVFRKPPHHDIYLKKNPHPLELGFRVVNFSEPKGQFADYRLKLSDGTCIHASEYINCIGYHWDKVDPSDGQEVEHLRRDSPITYVLLTMIVGAVAGVGWSLLTNNKKDLKKNAITGGVLGLGFGITTAEWE